MALNYSVVEGWEQLPKGYAHRDVAGVAVDGEDRVYLICRGDHPIIVYDQKGNFMGSWGEGLFTLRPHGITIAPDGTLYCSDDGNHTVRRFTPQGKLLMTLGTHNTPSDTCYHRPRPPPRAEVHAAGQAPDDPRHPEHAVGHRLRRQEHCDRQAARRTLQPADEPRGRSAGRSLRVRRLRKLPRPSLLAQRRA